MPRLRYDRNTGTPLHDLPALDRHVNDDDDEEDVR